VANLSDAPQKINGLAGVTLGAFVSSLPLFRHRLTFVPPSIVQSFSTIILGVILGTIFIWKVGLVGIGEFSMNVNACSRSPIFCAAVLPLLVSAGYIRLVCANDYQLVMVRLIVLSYTACSCPQGPEEQEGTRGLCPNRLRGCRCHTYGCFPDS
jgi:hypothetical protein